MKRKSLDESERSRNYANLGYIQHKSLEKRLEMILEKSTALAKEKRKIKARSSEIDFFQDIIMRIRST